MAANRALPRPWSLLPAPKKSQPQGSDIQPLRGSRCGFDRQRNTDNVDEWPFVFIVAERAPYMQPEFRIVRKQTGEQCSTDDQCEPSRAQPIGVGSGLRRHWDKPATLKTVFALTGDKPDPIVTLGVLSLVIWTLTGGMFEKCQKRTLQ
jgi:hypothetical protein